MMVLDSARVRSKGTYTEGRKRILKRYRDRQRTKASAFEKTLRLMARNEAVIPEEEIQRYFRELTEDETELVIRWLKDHS